MPVRRKPRQRIRSVLSAMMPCGVAAVFCKGRPKPAPRADNWLARGGCEKMCGWLGEFFLILSFYDSFLCLLLTLLLVLFCLLYKDRKSSLGEVKVQTIVLIAPFSHSKKRPRTCQVQTSDDTASRLPPPVRTRCSYPTPPWQPRILRDFPIFTKKKPQTSTARLCPTRVHDDVI